jgi:hypothetical protein
MPNFTWTDNANDPCPLDVVWQWDAESKPVGQRCIPYFMGSGERATHIYKGLHADCKLRQAEIEADETEDIAEWEHDHA